MVGVVGTGLWLATAGCASRSPVVVRTSGDAIVAGISVSGHGEASGAPDTLVGDVGVSILRSNVGDAMQEAARRLSAILAATQRLGIPRQDVQTTNYSVGAEYGKASGRRNRAHPRRPVGYRVTHTLTIRMRDLQRAGTILDSVATAAGNDATIGALRFVIENDRSLRAHARADAWKDARAKAEQLARLSGARPGMAVVISESGTAPIPMPFAEQRATAMGASAVTPIEPGQLKVSVVVEVRFAME